MLVLDATGMRVGELEKLTWVTSTSTRAAGASPAAVAKTSKARWVAPPDVVFDAVASLCPRDDRTALDYETAMRSIDEADSPCERMHT